MGRRRDVGDASGSRGAGCERRRDRRRHAPGRRRLPLRRQRTADPGRRAERAHVLLARGRPAAGADRELPLMRSAVVLGAVACAVIAFWQPEAHPALRLTGARGPLVLSNSSEGRAILTAANLRPGQSVAGSVVLSNRGTAPARLVLRSSPPHGGARPRPVLRRPPPRGGRPAGAPPLPVAGGRGPAAAGAPRALAGCHARGALRGGASRRYRLVARFPRGGRRDNAYARSRV